jgi:hypothetical protein
VRREDLPCRTRERQRSARFILNHVDQPTQNRARNAVTAALRSYEESDGVRLRGAAWLVTATRPKQ